MYQEPSILDVSSFTSVDTIKEAVERECPQVVSCADILVLSAREGIVSLGGPYIPLKTGRRNGRKSRAEIIEQYLPDYNERISVVFEFQILFVCLLRLLFIIRVINPLLARQI